MTLIQRKAIPRSIIKVTAMTEVVINTTIKNMSMFKFFCQRVRGRDTGGPIVQERNQPITIIRFDRAADGAEPPGEGRRHFAFPRSRRTQDFAHLVAAT